jgi:hypothetical protein
MTRYETPAFDPNIAFSWTLRSEEIARLRRRRSVQAQVGARYESPAFEPGIAFSWTLRSAEIARRQSSQPRKPQADRVQLNVLAAA